MMYRIRTLGRHVMPTVPAETLAMTTRGGFGWGK